MYAAVRLVANLGLRDPLTESMIVLHWLPIAYRVMYELCPMMQTAVNGWSAAYITETLVPTASLLNRARLHQRWIRLMYHEYGHNSVQDHFLSLALLLGTNTLSGSENNRQCRKYYAEPEDISIQGHI